MQKLERKVNIIISDTVFKSKSKRIDHISSNKVNKVTKNEKSPAQPQMYNDITWG